MMGNLILSLLGGGMLAAAFPLSFSPEGPAFSWPLLAYLGVVPLLFALRRANSAWHAYLLGFAAGTAETALAVFWLNSFGALAVVSLSLYQGFTFGFLGVALHLVLRGHNERFNFLLVPAVWIGYEYLHSIGAASFPWLHLGYTQFAVLPLLQLASLGGQYAVSWFVLLAGYTLFHLLGGRQPLSARLRALAAAAAVLLLVYAWGVYSFSRTAALEERLPTWRVAVVQGGLSSNVPWHLEEYRTAAYDAYVSTTSRMLQAEAVMPDLVVWPEGALPAWVDLAAPRLDSEAGRLWDLEPRLSLLFGLLTPSPRGLQNSALLFVAPDRLAGYYTKNRPVAFGEFVPLGRIIRMLDYPWGPQDLREGKSAQPIPYRGQAIAANICYDSVHPAVTREQVRRGATLVTVLANNSWYELPSGAAQHRMFDYFRAVENRRTLIRAATTGVSGFILPSGRDAGSIGRNQQAWLAADAPVNRIRSFYTVVGDLFAILMLLVAALGVAWRAASGVSEDMF